MWKNKDNGDFLDISIRKLETINPEIFSFVEIETETKNGIDGSELEVLGTRDLIDKIFINEKLAKRCSENNSSLSGCYIRFDMLRDCIYCSTNKYRAGYTVFNPELILGVPMKPVNPPKSLGISEKLKNITSVLVKTTKNKRGYLLLDMDSRDFYQIERKYFYDLDYCDALIDMVKL